MRNLTLFIIGFFLSATSLLGQKKVTQDANGGTYERRDNTVTYSWSYEDENGKIHNLSFSINFRRGWKNMQRAYKARKHNHGNYSKFIKNDPFKDDLTVLSSILADIAQNINTNKADLALSFVQALPYQKMGSYQRYAVETLIDAKGDCSDTSVLLAGIFAAWNYGCVFIHLPNHLAVGLWSSHRSGVHYYYNGRNYFFCETTGTGFKIGDAADLNEAEKIEEVDGGIFVIRVSLKAITS